MRKILTIALLCLSAPLMQAQVTIGGSVFGGARQADVKGSSFVNIGGENTSCDIIIHAVYGGNDIAGSIGVSDTVPSVLQHAAECGVTDADGNDKGKNKQKYNAFIYTHKEGEGRHLFIGKLFGGGYGNYTYTEDGDSTYTVTLNEDTLATHASMPNLDKTYLELCGGTFGYVYGGGDSVTVTKATNICISNVSNIAKVSASTQTDNEEGVVVKSAQLAAMGINTAYYNNGFQFSRVFGGNNKAAMDIRPTWHLKEGSIENLYSGGNEGNMTNEEGLLLEIMADSKIMVDNLYGGCRKADVHPLASNGNEVDDPNLVQLSDVDENGTPKYRFPAGLSARVLVRGGDINNVYGGNDVTGRVYGGNAVGIYASIRGNVYGGGNGSYPYTDNELLKTDPIYGDFYYERDGKSAVEALNDFRPNAEQVSIRLYGTAAQKTLIGGSVYIGGNSATLKTTKASPMVELKVGSNVIADNIYLGNNGENMVKSETADDVLQVYCSTEKTSDASTFNSMDLTDPQQFATYMDGAAMNLMPHVVFDAVANGDPDNYAPYSTYFGSLFCGGNVGSMTMNGKTSLNFQDKIIVYNKVVGGCNNANVARTKWNAAYEGGLIGSAEAATGNKLEMSFSGLKIQPKRWNSDKTSLVWNTVSASTGEDTEPVTEGASEESPVISTAADHDRRFDKGSIYGGCYNSGHVNGNVVINLNESVIDLNGEFAIFDKVLEDEDGEVVLDEEGNYTIIQRRSGVILDEQGIDVLGTALNVFGGGYGEDSEIWGSSTINLKRGYAFQIFGGGEHGAIGKGVRNAETNKLEYTYDERYSTYINLNGTVSGVHKGDEGDSPDMAETEYLYGGGFEGPVAGNTIVTLDNGRIYDSFAGSCNADIYGHTETYVGLNGFPYVRDNIYGGNDLGGRILGKKNFKSRVRDEEVLSKVYQYDAIDNPDPSVLTASAYIEYIQGRIDSIFGGSYGYYDYKAPYFKAYTYTRGEQGIPAGSAEGTARVGTGFTKPRLDNVFINFRPSNSNNRLNKVEKLYGAGQGFPGEIGKDSMQVRSYVLINAPKEMTAYQNTEVFGSGAYGGIGMGIDPTEAETNPDTVSAVIDLISGQLKNVYGASYKEGFTRRTVVNVPEGSTIHVNNIFGGGCGTIEQDEDGNEVARNDVPCDAYEATVNYHSTDAVVAEAIYGGNNSCRRTLYGTVNISVPVYNSNTKTTLATVYGAGYGKDTWSQYTEVNLTDGASVYEVYGGGHDGMVLNKQSVDTWHDTWEQLYMPLGAGYSDMGLSSNLATYKYNTNVLINEGATVKNYAYGGGRGNVGGTITGTVSGTTHIELLGGTVAKDLYGGGWGGPVQDKFRTTGENAFVASTHVNIEGGNVRNVYGGGYQGAVGYHDAETTDTDTDIAGETHVVIGKVDGTSIMDGIPAIHRSTFGGGEQGAVYGTANLTINNGYVGYTYNAQGSDDPSTDLDEHYEENLNDPSPEDPGIDLLKPNGNAFGGGYGAGASTDITQLTVFGGHIRNSLFGGGEIAAVGRGTAQEGGEANHQRELIGIYKAGKTNLKLYDGHVHRNVFGGGRGYNTWGEMGQLYTDGYVFGQTEVHIYGGEIGTEEGLAQGFGNVFGGGDIGYVYSAYENDKHELSFGKKSGERYDNEDEGYYYRYEDGAFVTDGSEKILTEDCKVLIEPHCKVLGSNVTIGGTTYGTGEYIPTSTLNMLKNKVTDAAIWEELDTRGIIIHNAVFAGGNTSSGSAMVYANATTVYGNATASIHDIFHRDLITVGTGHTGGLYGDGNLTFVDGYRGLNITNYGTDYYTIQKEIDIDAYHALPDREAAYYELRYKCLKECTDKEGTRYTTGDGGNVSRASTITADELITLFEGVTDNGVSILNADGTPNPAYWEENGVCSRYAGRLMNTIQRADFCGVFGSRMVMQGAQDRVPEAVDYTNYTINRVREISLNKKFSIAGDAVDSDEYQHGNYFGIYNIVNFLGGLTSDFNFGDETGEGDVRTSTNTDTDTYSPDKEGQTFYEWKSQHINERKRNNGNSHNQVALASGVYLELTTEKSTGTGLYEKDWGIITGVIELDLINVQTGIGGGFVYARNIHGKRSLTGKKHITLTELNKGAMTSASFQYTTDDASQQEWQTSGNFVHSTQTIIDDCYNVSGKYSGSDAVPAHYWYIKGQVYIYDQYISAYTGAPNAYSEAVNIPLTITAASHGTMKLMKVRPNRYAYYSSPGVPLSGERKININDVTYQLNDPISYWDWFMLSASEKSLFVEETYVSIAACKIGDTTYPEGTVLLPGTDATDAGSYKALKAANPKVYHLEKGQEVDFDFIFRSSNNLGHDTGYILTYNVTNPTTWNTWHTPTEGEPVNKINETAYDKLTPAGKTNYTNGPTYRLASGNGGVFGQREYQVSNIIEESIYDTYQDIKKNHPSAIPEGQAEFEAAYIVTEEMSPTPEQHLYPGAIVAKSNYTDDLWASMGDKLKPAYICTSTIPLDKTTYIYANTRMTADERATYLSNYPDLTDNISKLIVPAYYCIAPGLYGGNYYESGKNYRGLTAWCSMSQEDRDNFTFNYDALDLLIDPTYGQDRADGHMFQYDGAGFTTPSQAETNKAGYSLTQPVDYSATYHGSGTLTYKDSDNNTHTVAPGQELSRETFETIPNEKHYYTPISVEEEGTHYVVNTSFIRGESPYAVGQTITRETYNSLSEEDRKRITLLSFTNADKGSTYYFCRESYEIGHNGEGMPVKGENVAGATMTGTYGNGDTVPLGLVISASNYATLVNKQTSFTIHGIAPIETSTLYVSRNSDIFDLSKEKIITVIYQYDYEESDVTATHITPISERHVVNIHIQFKSGIPEVEDIAKPKTVLPGTLISLGEPHVTPGAYEVTGGGWELFGKESDAESHTNGIEYSPTNDALYWYQDGFYVAYYAKTYLGKTYSNHVPVSVANYHDLTRVMNDKEHHYYVDEPSVKRNSKIYITDPAEGLNQLKNLFDLSLLNDASEGVADEKVTATGALEGHALLNEQVKAGQNLEFILHTDINQTGDWTPIANEEGECFEGRLHGDGYSINGLTHSLFNHLCGEVYNLGITGSFTGAGVAETGEGYVENCWVKTSGTPTKAEGERHYAVFGNPSRTGGDLIQMVNCYYPETNGYQVPADDTHGKAQPMPERAFYNGTVAYNLNGFYLYKRYTDKLNLTSGTEHRNFYINEADNTLTEPQKKFYQGNAKYCSSGYNGLQYVEERYADGDFIYAGGYIPTTAEERLYVAPANNARYYYPIYPDDYLYFGQMLTYGYNNSRKHEDAPAHLYKDNGRLSMTDRSNRVYRAPAYYRSADMDVAHFNCWANLAAYSKPESALDTNLKEAYPYMTAIDFAGHNDTAYKLGANGHLFYQPLLDDDGLQSITNNGETPNLVVYAPSAAANTRTYEVLNNYFIDPNHSDYDEESAAYEDGHEYGRIASATAASTVQGHLVQGNLEATSDHLLIDKQDFNAPIAYSMGNHRMWYQRTPDNFVNRTEGWEGISLPFTAELVATSQKGEITHFYQGHTTGHEYWLREYAGHVKPRENEDGTYTADFNPLATGNNSKDYANTYLWDTYYSRDTYLDKNEDQYQKLYYSSGYLRDLYPVSDYPYLTSATPYIVGFPGQTYYEFDLSGQWTPSNRYNNEAIENPGKQTITFVSEKGTTIGVSDDELKNNAIDGYTFMPNYMGKEVEGYLLDGNGSSFDQTPTPTAATPFRPYFIASTAPGKGRRAAERIVMGNSDNTSLTFDDNDPRQGEVNGQLTFYTKKHLIGVTSSLHTATDVLIANTSGLTIASFTIQPGETIETKVPMKGIYIVRAADGKHHKKISVK